MKTNQYLDASGKQYQKEASTITCPVCKKEVDILYGEDEGGIDPNRGRMGCEDCWKPLKSRTEAYIPPSPSQVFEGIEVPKINTTQDLIKELERS